LNPLIRFRCTRTISAASISGGFGFLRGFEARVYRLEIDYQRLRTDAPLDLALIEYLERRAAV
jgi:hypothetical protein